MARNFCGLKEESYRRVVCSFITDREQIGEVVFCAKPEKKGKLCICVQGSIVCAPKHKTQITIMLYVI